MLDIAELTADHGDGPVYGSLHFDVDHSHDSRPRPGWKVLRFWEIPARSSTRAWPGTFQNKSLSKRIFARRRERDHARTLGTASPTKIEALGEQSSAQRAGEVMAANTPIEAGAAERATPADQAFGVDSDSGKESLPGPGELQSAVAGSQLASLLEAIENEHAQFAGKMVVAHAGLSQGGLARARPKANRTRPKGYAHEVFEKLRDVATAETEIAVPSLGFYGDQPRLEQLGEVGADGLLGHAGDLRELGCGQRFAGGERGQDFRPGVVADQGSDADDIRSVFHGSMVDEPLGCCKVLS